jgi:hypothetical protein
MNPKIRGWLKKWLRKPCPLDYGICLAECWRRKLCREEGRFYDA